MEAFEFPYHGRPGHAFFDRKTRARRLGKRLMATREQNERKFGQWKDAGGGRHYWFDVQGRHGWRARYLKLVDVNENTVRFWQEIYDQAGKLVEIHQKVPVDDGHQKV